MPSMSEPPPDRSAFRERLAMYALGIAIGFMILGLIYSMRRQAAQRQTTPPPATTPTR
jgi:hypothetical protein